MQDQDAPVSAKDRSKKLRVGIPPSQPPNRWTRPLSLGIAGPRYSHLEPSLSGTGRGIENANPHSLAAAPAQPLAGLMQRRIACEDNPPSLVLLSLPGSGGGNPGTGIVARAIVRASPFAAKNGEGAGPGTLVARALQVNASPPDRRPRYAPNPGFFPSFGVSCAWRIDAACVPGVQD